MTHTDNTPAMDTEEQKACREAFEKEFPYRVDMAYPMQADGTLADAVVAWITWKDAWKAALSYKKARLAAPEMVSQFRTALESCLHFINADLDAVEAKWEALLDNEDGNSLFDRKEILEQRKADIEAALQEK